MTQLGLPSEKHSRSGERLSTAPFVEHIQNCGSVEPPRLFTGPQPYGSTLERTEVAGGRYGSGHLSERSSNRAFASSSGESLGRCVSSDRSPLKPVRSGTPLSPTVQLSKAASPEPRTCWLWPDSSRQRKPVVPIWARTSFDVADYGFRKCCRCNLLLDNPPWNRLELRTTVPSSRGLGHRPLTAETGVRNPLGLPKITRGYGHRNQGQNGKCPQTVPTSSRQLRPVGFSFFSPAPRSPYPHCPP